MGYPGWMPDRHTDHGGRRAGAFLVLLALCGCDSLWQGFLSENPRSCVQNPGICQVGEVCNPQTRLCEGPMAGMVTVPGGTYLMGSSTMSVMGSSPDPDSRSD